MHTHRRKQQRRPFGLIRLCRCDLVVYDADFFVQLRERLCLPLGQAVHQLLDLLDLAFQLALLTGQALVQ